MDKINNLNQTVELMISEDYKERLIAEYVQVKIRYLRLERVLKSVSDKTAPDCITPTFAIESLKEELLEEQLVIMRMYIKLLVKRSVLEGIILPEVEI